MKQGFYVLSIFLNFSADRKIKEPEKLHGGKKKRKKKKYRSLEESTF